MSEPVTYFSIQSGIPRRVAESSGQRCPFASFAPDSSTYPEAKHLQSMLIDMAPSMEPTRETQQQNGSPQLPFYAEAGFYDQANALRVEFEEKLAASIQANAGITPLTYVFSENQCQLLTASSEQVFTRAILDDLIDRIGAWATATLGTFHVSTPQVRVYINGCKRELVRDSIHARWHYLLSLTREWPRASWVKVLAGAGHDDRRFDVAPLIKSKLVFNQLVVHDAGDAYGIDFSSRVMNPARGIVFLDGYLW